MVSAGKAGIILEGTDLKFESLGVLNPAFIEVDGVGHLFYRAIGFDSISSIGYCQLENNRVIKRFEAPLLFPEYDFEKRGLEDPRIVRLGDTYYLFYTAFDGKNAMVAYATSSDLVSFEKQGLISPRIPYVRMGDFFKGLRHEEKYLGFLSEYRRNLGEDVVLWEKDAFIFPRKIQGRYALIHRVLPGIQIIYFDSFSDLSEKYWKDYFSTFHESIVLEPEFEFETWIGGGSPPIETEEGWLLIYHCVEMKEDRNIYHASAALLDLEDPQKVIGRLNYPLFSPEEPWELEGVVNNVVFPSGAHIKGDILYIYYGAADKTIGARSFDLKEVLRSLKDG